MLGAGVLAVAAFDARRGRIGREPPVPFQAVLDGRVIPVEDLRVERVHQLRNLHVGRTGHAVAATGAEALESGADVGLHLLDVRRRVRFEAVDGRHGFINLLFA